ncbi:DUF4012 domain-containing protein [Rhodococcus sp. BP-349]|uniref:DUF4012 domain-containing protein n=1 Tax=unclassified Rhodococcus (in: high G+C Gram-positive bacteria) TaxID=192944 RepID=UPI001C9B64A3|nr:MULTISPECIES: DUF4012 domain-containing protein [unclassified Rhodococcus (in: high G+C Gram-positive bacteria)]MBY6538100.1 DUF4012 domain-containing protein [Rhodococcus sp. BP-363]MBY6542437.1 DUF4012 domain-containing protein [Rhodococcus sp. BP-369]MBY6561667.1 DUF4012 domain-containing protein [Rhodococcus sp. BP-370]MBY6575959.1 DUF4012 domain-containing protein [Rhodococcus sp. BP-364]MBY6585260.1 DUF4012 domain-containing protein [Rhodococcus sp. BP-358]
MVIVLGLLGWLAWTAHEAYAGLTEARDEITATMSAVSSGDPVSATAGVDAARSATTRAVGATDSLIWKAASAMPVLGSPFDVTAFVAHVVEDVVTEVLSPAAAAGIGLDPSELRGDDGTIAVALLRDAEPTLVRMYDGAALLESQSMSVDTTTYVPLVTAAADAVKRQLSDLTSLLRTTSTAARVVPDMVGETTPRSYFVALQTNAEARATGGLIGGFAVITADRGRLSLDELATNSELDGDYAPMDLGAEFTTNYEGRYRATSHWQNANVSPHFPYTGQILRSIWEQESGQQVDGVVATDPVALSYILDVVGPITLPDGEQIDARNVVEATESTAYARFSDDNAARKAYLQDIAARTFARMQSPVVSTAALVRAVGRGVSEGHTALWSADPLVQSELSGTAIAHEVPEDSAPYANVVVNNGAGGKLDYFLERDVVYTAGSCSSPTRESRIDVTLTNTAPARDYPAYVSGRFTGSTSFEGPPGTNRSLVEVFTTAGARLNRATVDGVPLLMLSGTERGHPVFYAPIVSEPGQSRTVVLELVEPTAGGQARVPVQPQVRDASVVVDVPDCSHS